MSLSKINYTKPISDFKINIFTIIYEKIGNTLLNFTTPYSLTVIRINLYLKYFLFFDKKGNISKRV